MNTDHFGYYKPVLLNGKPSDGHYHEQYPHMVTGWIYDHKYLNRDFNYEDLEQKYLNEQAKTGQSQQDLKQQLDQAHGQ